MKTPLSKDKYYNLWILLSQTRDALFKARDKELSQYGISAMESSALFIIQLIGGKATPAEISRYIFREHHTVTALLKRMEKGGLITKVRDFDRKNMWRVSLTKKGGNAYRQSLKRETIHTVMSHLSESECQQLESSLRKVRAQALKHLVTSEPSLPFP